MRFSTIHTAIQGDRNLLISRFKSDEFYTSDVKIMIIPYVYKYRKSLVYNFIILL